MNNNQSSEGLPDETVADDTLSKEEREYIDSLIEDDESYQISLEISNVYISGEKEKALGMYDEELGKALEKKDYDLYFELVDTRSTMLDLDDQCQESVAFYDTIDINRFPTDYHMAFYNMAASESAACGNVERENYWSGKINELQD